MRLIMILLTFKVRLLICMSILFTFTSTVGAEILSPPTKIPFAKDVIIEKYAHGQPLNLFTYIGKWEVKAIEKRLSLVGTSDKAPVYLLSKDKLSKKPKSFKLDFIVKDINKECGFVYGDVGVILVKNQVLPAIFDSKINMLKATSTKSKAISHATKVNQYTLDINTGYDPTGGPNQVCVIYINGVGIQFDCPNKDNRFGVYLGPMNSITISNIRWSIGSK